MKKLQIVALVSMVFVSGGLFSLDEQKSYSNQLNSIHKFGNKVILSFEKENPICSYVPASYEEVESSVYRYFMPCTKTVETLSTDLDMRESEGGVELVLHGQNIRKIEGEYHITFLILDEA